MSISLFHPAPYVDVQIRPAIQNNILGAEVVWTYLVARKTIKAPQAIVRKLCGTNEQLPEESSVWLETFLFPTRIRKEEQKTWKIRSDLAIGHLELANDRNNQIQSNGEWLCIAESKWFDDIHANGKIPGIYQLSQIIDHALLLHDRKGQFPERVYVTLITPRYFKEKQGKFSERLYWSKYNDYKSDPEKLENNLRLCPIPFLKHDADTLVKRIEALRLNWITFEELLDLPNLVEDQVPGKYKVTMGNWKQIFTAMGEDELYYELAH